MVDALFVDPKGPYPELLGSDRCWDEARDARTYDGPGPVVAHPPCNLWVNFAAVNWKRYARKAPAWYPEGTDGGCFAAALAAVRRCAGASRRYPCMGVPQSAEACATWLVTLPVSTTRVGLRGLAISVRAPRSQAHVVALRRRLTATRAPVGTLTRNRTSRLVRPQQAYCREARGVRVPRALRPPDGSPRRTVPIRLIQKPHCMYLSCTLRDATPSVKGGRMAKPAPERQVELNVYRCDPVTGRVSMSRGRRLVWSEKFRDPDLVTLHLNRAHHMLRCILQEAL